MHRLAEALVCAVVMFTVTAAARAEASYPEAVRLVRSMRADELLTVALYADLAANTGPGRWTRQQAACLSKIKYPLFTDAIALAIAPKLTDAEVAEAIEFYRSDAGRKSTEQTYEDLRNDVEDNVFRGLNPDELRATAKFFKRPVGNKVEQIVEHPEVLQRVDARLKIALEDCEYDATGEIKSWSSSPVRAPNGECSASKDIVDFAHADVGIETRIQVTCPSSGHAIAHFKGRIDGVGFRWLDSNAIEVIHPAGVTPARRFQDKKFKITYRQRTSADPPAPKSWPKPKVNSTLSVEFNETSSQPFWMSYVDREQCLMAKRVERSQIPGARDAAVVQFVKVANPEYPFGTRELVLFETASGYGASSAVIRGSGVELAMNPGGGGFHVSGQAAETVLRAIAGGQLKIEIKPATGTPFSIDLAPTDFAWALPPFERCISGLGPAVAKK